MPETESTQAAEGGLLTADEREEVEKAVECGAGYNSARVVALVECIVAERDQAAVAALIRTGRHSAESARAALVPTPFASTDTEAQR